MCLCLSVVFPFVCLLACVFQGQTPFDVADESVEALLEELSQTQASVSLSLYHFIASLERMLFFFVLFFRPPYIVANM